MSDTVFSPRVVGDLRPDFHSLESVLTHPRFAGKRGEPLALAIYDYFTSTVDGTWHWWTPNENAGDPYTWGDVEDPVKLLNCYGWMLCATNAALLQSIYRAAGMPSRIRSLPGHAVCEVYYEDRWHILDVDMWTWFRTPEGHLASVEELSAAPRALILDNQRKSQPCNLPDRSLEDYAEMYAQTAQKEKVIYPLWAARTHTMDFMLRPGESLLRAQASAGRFHIPATWAANRKKFATEWTGQPRERYQPFRTVGNGRWIYAPDLTSHTRDVELGAWSREGLSQDATGLAGPGSIVFRIQSPYPFCGVPDPDKDGFPARDGVRLETVGIGLLRVEAQDAEGRWVEVETGTADLTNLLAARYETMLRLTLEVGAHLTELHFDGWLQMAPMSLPRMVAGDNRMRVERADQFGLCTTPWRVPVDFRTESALRATLVELERGTLQPGARERLKVAPPAEGPAVAVYRFDAPVGRPFAWAYAVSTIPEGPTDAAQKQAVLEWSLDGQTWHPLATIAIPNTPLQWDGSIDGQVRPPAPAQRLWLRVSSDTGMTALQFTGHIAEPAIPGKLDIVHRWREAGVEREFIAPGGADEYTLTCGADPCDHSIEMRMPSVPR